MLLARTQGVDVLWAECISPWRGFNQKPVGCAVAVVIRGRKHVDLQHSSREGW